MLKSSISGGLFVRVDGVRTPTVAGRPAAAFNHSRHDPADAQHRHFSRAPATDGLPVGISRAFITCGVLHG